MPSTDETMERLKQQSDRILSEVGYLRRELAEGRLDRLDYIRRQYSRLDIESLAIQREAMERKKPNQ